MRRAILAALVAAALPCAAGAETLIERDARGAVSRRVEVRPNGRTEFRDRTGRLLGSQERRGSEVITRDRTNRRAGPEALQPDRRR